MTMTKKEERLCSDLIWAALKSCSKQMRPYIKIVKKTCKAQKKKVYKNNSIYRFLREKLKENKKLQKQMKMCSKQQKTKQEKSQIY